MVEYLNLMEKNHTKIEAMAANRSKEKDEVTRGLSLWTESVYRSLFPLFTLFDL